MVETQKLVEVTRKYLQNGIKPLDFCQVLRPRVLDKSPNECNYDSTSTANIACKEIHMSSFSIRGIDEELALLLKKTAASEHKSVNQFLLETIKKQLGLKKEKRYTQDWHDLDSLFGKWSKEDFDGIQGKITAERQIDEELWK
jgi:hypothetical protein